MQEATREAMVAAGRSLHGRGLTPGNSGNLSVRVDEGFLITPTSSCLGHLDPGRLARLDSTGANVDGDPPSKEAPLHIAVYRSRPDAQAVVHLHSPHAVAVSCIDGLPTDNLLPALTAYYVMRIGRLPLVGYHPPGAPELAEAVEEIMVRHHAVLLANHGPVVAGLSLEAAVDAVEELEATARLYLLLQGHAWRPLTPAQAAALRP